MAKKISDAVKDPAWQKLRASLVGKWVGNEEACLQKVLTHFGDCSSRHDPRFLRVYNYLTCSGFRSGNISHPVIDRFLAKLRKMRKEQP